MLKVWGRRSSFNVQKVLWLIAELDLPYEHLPAGGDFGQLDSAAFRVLNPHGRVPVLQDGATTVWESHAILRYLAAEHGGGDFWNPAPAARAIIDGWMDWSQTALQPAFLGGVFWGFYRTPEAKRDNAAIDEALRRTHQCLTKIEDRLIDRPFVAGATLSLADIPIGAGLYRYYELEIERPRLPRLEAYYHRLRARQAYREAVMTPFDDLKGRLAF